MKQLACGYVLMYVCTFKTVCKISSYLSFTSIADILSPVTKYQLVHMYMTWLVKHSNSWKLLTSRIIGKCQYVRVLETSDTF